MLFITNKGLFKTYIDEYRKEYFNEGDILDCEIYEQR